MSENGRSIANCMGYTTNSDNGEHITESLANAKLIVAAPKMLDVLNDCLETINILLIELHQKDVILLNELTQRKKQILLTIKKATE